MKRKKEMAKNEEKIIQKRAKIRGRRPKKMKKKSYKREQKILGKGQENEEK